MVRFSSSVHNSCEIEREARFSAEKYADLSDAPFSNKFPSAKTTR